MNRIVVIIIMLIAVAGCNDDVRAPASVPATPKTLTGVGAGGGILPTTSAPVATATPVEVQPPPANAYYRSCDEAIAAGAAPLHRGEPGYRAGLDRDGDGVACEVGG